MQVFRFITLIGIEEPNWRSQVNVVRSGSPYGGRIVIVALVNNFQVFQLRKEFANNLTLLRLSAVAWLHMKYTNRMFPNVNLVNSSGARVEIVSRDC